MIQKYSIAAAPIQILPVEPIHVPIELNIKHVSRYKCNKYNETLRQNKEKRDDSKAKKRAYYHEIIKPSKNENNLNSGMF